MTKEDLRIIFMGTPDFAVGSFKALLDAEYNVVACITVPDRKAGRGQKLKSSPVKEFAVENNIPVLQPEKLRSEEFLNDLKNYKADLFIVVAFRMLPEVVWNMPSLGTFNLHASLLPNYRGAAPINHAIINGESKTGVTTFFLDHEIDTGNIILQESLSIDHEDNFESLHDKMMEVGSKLVVKTVDSILEGSINLLPQDNLINSSEGIKHAPKIFTQDCEINWAKDAHTIYNFIRGLSPWPVAWTNILSDKETRLLKIYSSDYMEIKHEFDPGILIKESNSVLKVACKNGFIFPKEVQLAGKKRMLIEEFLRGFQYDENLRLG